MEQQRARFCAPGNFQTAYKEKIQTSQKALLTVMLTTMALGLIVLSLGILVRPLLRITRPELFDHAEWILNLMICVALCQLGTSGFNCFAACWKLIWTGYLAIGLTGMTIFLEFVAIGTSLHLINDADQLANEEVVSPWYWIECQREESCHNRIIKYLMYMVLPQITLCCIAICFHVGGIVLLSRIVRTVANHKKYLNEYKEWYHETMDKPEKRPKKSKKKSKKSSPPEEEDEETETDNATGGPSSSSIEMTPMKQASNIEIEDLSAEKKQSYAYNANYHTPSSILKVDHGYVAASGGTLDYLDVDSSPEEKPRNRKSSSSSPESDRDKAVTTPSISFKTDVQVHHYDPSDQICTPGKDEN